MGFSRTGGHFWIHNPTTKSVFMKNVFLRIAGGLAAFLIVRFVMVTAFNSYHQQKLDRDLHRLKEAEQRTAEAFRRFDGR